MRFFHPVLFLFLFLNLGVFCAFGTDPYDKAFEERKLALKYLDSIGVLSISRHWPSINPLLFSQNLRKNISSPVYLFGGRNTNFCGYSALTYSCLNNEPLRYAQFMIEVYKNGQASYRNVHFKPTERLKNAPGLLIFKGILDINHADQLWFLLLADHFKGYINWINMRYDPGDENTIWASTNLAKFNRMLKKLFEYDIKSKGSDLIRPSIRPLIPYLKKRMANGEVFLYLNNTILYKKKHKVKTRIPTHYVILQDIIEENDIITFTYWDYGLKTLIKLPARVVKKILYAVIWYPNKETL